MTRRTIKLGTALLSTSLLTLGCVGDDIPIGESSSTDDEVGEPTTETDTEESTDTTEESTDETTEEESSTDTTEEESTETTTETSGTTDSADTLGDDLDEIPPEEWEPTPNPDGVPTPLPGVYDDLGEADPDDGFRALIGLDLRNREELEDFVLDVSDPNSPAFGQYMTVDELLENHAPLESDFNLLQAWLDFEGLSVNYLATNRMLIQFSGLVGQFNEAFNTTLHVCMRKNPQQGNDPIPVYCTPDPMTLPIFVADRSPGIVTADLLAEEGSLPNEAGEITVSPPSTATNGSRLTPARVAQAYDVDDLYALGYDGSGQKIGVVMGAAIHYKWAQTFWQSFGIVRTNPEVLNLMEDPITRYVESQLDNTWAGAMAPGAEIVSYAGPDSRNTSIVFVYNEALTRAPLDGVSVITTSFAHREDSEPEVVRNQYDHSSLIGAALGLTVLAATGDSAQTDTPSSSPWCSGAGGTRLHWSGSTLAGESLWDESGSGETLSFDIPDWQVAAVADYPFYDSEHRMTADLSAAASPYSPYWVYYNSNWALYGGTSFASPVLAGIITVINQYREDNGMAPMGYLNQILYTDEAVQATFRDITSGATEFHQAASGWDPGSGWGSPHSLELAQTWPSP
ncbi:peptidase S53 [Pseudenhygromyxa sp. WMMC2535]|uniref:S53 family peptidase n=1 Tax=Pseudenhygromyxa sp. WMMC2535 TaxID=2712867 RepID=UPI001552842C|nr:S53 family serine peptidase [Pseudenhygromyxa sp. WMMC2535]NVB42896.1 peptidase S53 [Pseudenhygromyxa sp. WMMC2535]